MARPKKHRPEAAPTYAVGDRVVYTAASAAFHGRTGELSSRMDRAGTLWAVRVEGEALLVASPPSHFEALSPEHKEMTA